MKKWFSLIVALVLVLALNIPALAGDVWVDGYYRQDGTYVRPHHRSTPDRNPWDSTRGNYTGRQSYQEPYPAWPPHQERDWKRYYDRYNQDRSPKQIR